MSKRLAILLSGKGSNMETIARNCAAGFIDASVSFVASDHSNAMGLEKARALGIPVLVLPYEEKGRAGAESCLLERFKQEETDLLVLAGFMRILSPWFVNQLRGKILNIHPALLPSFPGTNAIERAWKAGTKITGVTVHLVDEEVDHGPVLEQEPVRIDPEETLESLERKIHNVEHRLYSRVLREIASGNLSILGGKKQA